MTCSIRLRDLISYARVRDYLDLREMFLEKVLGRQDQRQEEERMFHHMVEAELHQAPIESHLVSAVREVIQVQ